MKATITKTWLAQYSPSLSGHCSACNQPNNGRSTDRSHSVTTLIMEGDDCEYDICDRHPNLSAAARAAWRRHHDTDCGPVTIVKPAGGAVALFSQPTHNNP